MAVRFWKKIYNPRKNKLKERSHKDGLSIGLTSVEALEEHFFKVQLNDSYIDQQSLRKHAVSADIIEQYKDYRNLVQDNPKKTYLAKNNNLLLRLESQLEQDDELNVILLYRNPLQHAASVLKQHLNFIHQQESDSFITTYMNWLGHHEFGKNHLPFDFERSNNPFATDSLNYHLQNWINYYQYALTYKNKDQILFVQFEKFIENPINIAKAINERFPFNLMDCKVEHHEPKPHEIDESNCDVNLLSQANEIFTQLQASS